MTLTLEGRLSLHGCGAQPTRAHTSCVEQNLMLADVCLDPCWAAGWRRCWTTWRRACGGGEVMYLHCWGGRGRAGTVGAAFLHRLCRVLCNYCMSVPHLLQHPDLQLSIYRCSFHAATFPVSGACFYCGCLACERRSILPPADGVLAEECRSVLRCTQQQMKPQVTLNSTDGLAGGRSAWSGCSVPTILARILNVRI